MKKHTAPRRETKQVVRSLFLLLGMALLATASGAQAAGAPESDGRPAILQDVGIDQRLDEQLPMQARFKDDTGREVALGDLFQGKPAVLAFVYYDCPMLCTQVLNGMTSALGVLKFDAGKEFEVIAISIDPRETPSVAAAKKNVYLQRYKRPGAAAGWHFLTGKPEAISAATKAAGFRYAWDKQTQQFAHASAVMIVTPRGRIAQYYYGIEYPPKDLRLGLVEASQNRIGTVVDHVLLYCYHYDPATGRYGAVVMNMLRAMAAATVLAMGTFVFTMVRRDLRQGKGGR